jgi:hypothetical protein
MPLGPIQVVQLATAINDQLNIPALTLIASKLGVNLPNIAPGATLFESATRLINHLNTQIPPRDADLLVELRQGNNPQLQALANVLLQPSYFAPTGDAHDAIVLGTTAFFARDQLRASLRKFTSPNPNTTRVLVVRGSEPGGKTFTWEFLRHLAFVKVGATPMRLRLRNTSYTPRQFVEQALRLLNLDPNVLPPAADDPQHALVDPFINAFKGEVVRLARPYWLVVDDLNDPTVTPQLRDAAYALGFAVEESRPPNLWLALLGYNPDITDSELHAVAIDEAEFPTPALVARHFDALATAGLNPLPDGRARAIADLLFAKYPTLDKEAMAKLTRSFESMGENLRAGRQP